MSVLHAKLVLGRRGGVPLGAVQKAELAVAARRDGAAGWCHLNIAVRLDQSQRKGNVDGCTARYLYNERAGLLAVGGWM